MVCPLIPSQLALRLAPLGVCVYVHGVEGRGAESNTTIAVFWELVASVMICWLCLVGHMCGFLETPTTGRNLCITLNPEMSNALSD